MTMELTKQYRFVPITQPPPGNQIDLVGLNAENSLCITDYQEGKFYPPVTHYLIADAAPFDRYAQASCNETINDLEKQLERHQNQTIQLRDLFAATALMAEFLCNRGTAIEPAVKFAYTIADKMLQAREQQDD